MTVLFYVLGVLLFAVGLAASIALHEIGHLVPAKKFGVRVTQYMVGFGPTAWSRQRGETEYGVKWIPLGGYIRMIGMFPPRRGESEQDAMRASSTGRVGVMVEQAVRARRARRGPGLAEQAREQSMAEIQPGDENRVFYKLPVPQKIIVMLGGPTMNLLIGTVLLAGVFMLYGLPVEKPGADVVSVSECVVSADAAQTQTACTPGDPKTPAYLAGLRPGDTIVSVAGQDVRSSASVGELVRPRIGQTVPVVVERGGQTLTLQVTPIENTVEVTAADGSTRTMRAGFLGITSQTPTVVERQPITAVPGRVGSVLAQTAGVVVRIPQKMVGVVQTLGSGERDPNGPISVVGVGRIAGEVTSAQGAWTAKLATMLGVLASLNFALFVFNLIPLLPLDGGHVAGAIWEGLRRQVARLRHRPDPGPVDVARLLPIAYGVATVLVVMSVILIYADIVNPIKLLG